MNANANGRAMLVATAYQPEAPVGRSAKRLVELGVVEHISHECVRQELKNDLKPWLRK